MKKALFLLSLLFVGAFQASAITNTWTGGGVVKKWDNDTNWSLSHKPLVTEDVVIPTGHTVDAIDFYCYMKTFVLQGSSVLNLDENFQVTDTALIASGATVNWKGGEFNGGGKMRNKGTINILNNSWFCVVQGNNVINNEGTINLPKVNSTTNTSNFAILNGTINNLASGIIDVKGNGNALYVSTGTLHQVNNWGVIKKTGGTGNNDFSVFLHNYPSGKIQVDSGSIKLVNYTDTLEGGTYNVATGTQLIINAETYYYGTLSGVLNGEFVLQGTIRVPTTASFNFTGTSNVLWNNGELSNGGTLTNNSKMIINPVCGLCAKYNGLTSFVNNSEVTIVSNPVVMGTGFFTNNASGVVTLNDGAGFYRYLGGTHALNNYGLIKKTSGTGVSEIDLDSTTNMGTIECNSGTLKINSWGLNHFINRSNGTIKGNAAFEFPGSSYASSRYTNKGITSPGGITLDTLWVNSNSYYYTTDSSVLDIQINGTTQGVTYDYLYITNGNADFAGKVKVTLGYAPALADTFIVATCSGSITSCTIDSTTTATFGAYSYLFKVECVRNNALKLSVKAITTGIQNIDLENGISVYPNPSSDFVNIKNNSQIAIKSIQIMNTIGQLVKTVDGNNGISLQELAAGNYFLKINSADNYCIKPIIKK